MVFAPGFSLAAPVGGLFILLVLQAVPWLRRYVRFVVPAVAGLSLLGALATLMEPVRPVVLSRWSPSAFFGVPLVIQADPLVWPLAVAAGCVVVGAALVQLGHREQPHFLAGFAALGMLAAVLGSMWAANLLTILVFWGWFDLAWALGMVVAGVSARRVALGGGVGGLATVTLWAGALVEVARGNSLSWHLASPSGMGVGLLLVAGVLRLGLYPFHLALPTGLRRSGPERATLFLGPVLGWGLLLRLAAVGGGALPGGGVLSWVGMASLVAGGLLSWTRSGAREVVTWAALAAAGAVLWGAAAVGDGAVWVLAGGGAAWALGVSLVSLGHGFDRAVPWWTVGPLFGGVVLLGFPLTPGALVVPAVVGDAIGGSAVGKVVAFLVGEGMLAAGLARCVLRPAAGQERVGPLEVIARAAGMALPALPLVVGGLHPPFLMPGSGVASLVGLLVRAGGLAWMVWLLAVGGGVALFWREGRFRRRVEPVLGLLHDLVHLDWALGLFLGGIGRLLRFFRATAELVEGAGAVLWALSISLLIMLALLGR